ncbi:MAG: hypothetical protein BEN19_07950 [Epulopiscium sp. Nuni2H_MBin003]|nr:MAG: hypothetical protein BEN19_07950 [Epulopiscium sp. Nuni2H_MBin003]
MIIPFAHRGDIGYAPENTLPAFERAASLNCSVELDIQFTKDNEVVVFHDKTLKRLGLGTNLVSYNTPISEMTWEFLKNIDIPYGGHLLNYFPEEGFVNEEFYYYPWSLDTSENIIRIAKKYNYDIQKILECYNNKYEQAIKLDTRTAKIMHFEEFLYWVKEQADDFTAEIEYKAIGLTRKVLDLIEKTQTSNKCILMSGVEEYNDEMQNYIAKNGKPNGLKLGANIRYLNDYNKNLIEDWDLYEVGLNANTYGKEEVKYLEQQGIKVFSNLGDTPAWWNEMQTNGTHAFKTNCLSKYLENYRSN